MPFSVLATKLYVPPVRPRVVRRPRLLERLNEGLPQGQASDRRLTLISAAAGCGKTALVSEWAAARVRPVAWLSLDAGDSDPVRFLAYLVAALRSVLPGVGAGVLAALDSPQPPPTEGLLTALLNEIAAVDQPFALVLDDYHVVDSPSVDQAISFVIEHQPPQMGMVIATREDPQLPLARWRARGHMSEIRAADLRFTPAEAAEFLNQVMGLGLSGEEVAALEARTEGWIAGLQLAALSMQGHRDTAAFIRSFTGGHRFVLDYLVEEVLDQQMESIQTFLRCTAILDRMCGPLCDAVMLAPSGSGHAVLEYLERANLFLVPLDNERRWYRYHHLFAELLRQKLPQGSNAAEGHIRASQWFEDQGLEMEAFQHAVSANDIERAERLMEGKGIPLHFRGSASAIAAWLDSLPESVLDARPLLRVRSATMSLTAGQTTGVEEKLQAAERALAGAEPDPQTRDLIGQIACARATLAVTRYQTEELFTQARRALEYLSPDNLRFRFTANWALATAYYFAGDRAASNLALQEALETGKTGWSTFARMLALNQMGRLQEMDNQLQRAAETYGSVLRLAGDQPGPNTTDAYFGLVRVHYQWNDLDAAQRYAEQSLQVARMYDRALDRFIISEVLLARIALARGDVAAAADMLAQSEQVVRQKGFLKRVPDLAAEQVLTLLRQGDVAAAARLAEAHDLPISQARVFLAQGETAKALALLEQMRRQMEAKDWKDEVLKVVVLLAVAHQANGDEDRARQHLGKALALAQEGGFIRLFVDEGPPMARLLAQAAAHGMMPSYVSRLLAAFAGDVSASAGAPASTSAFARVAQAVLVEPLSARELEILRLVAQGLSNRQIGERLYLALDTVKGHNRRIFEKLQVHRRTEAIARARELGLL